MTGGSKMKKIFIDTEFTNFHSKGLISVGLIEMESEEYFYMECLDYKVEESSEFVKENIIPLLSKEGESTKEVIRKMLTWLVQWEEYCFVGDSEIDYQIIIRETKLPKKCKGFIYIEHYIEEILNIRNEEMKNIILERFSEYCDEYFYKNNKKAHHALEDAKANRWAFLKAIGFEDK
jgi:hypothetical protein